jgi:receptor protein-tyrosine kinase
VIFDAPPLLVTTEAGTLAHRVGQVVMVVEADKTTQSALKSALAQLEGCSVFGILNKSTGSLNQEVFDYSRYRYSE